MPVAGADPRGLAPAGPARPVLHLSGPKLRAAFERLINASEPVGGVERFADAVRLKSTVFQDRLADGKAASLTRSAMEELVPLMATVRRRIGTLIDGRHWESTHAAIVSLLDGAHDTSSADERVARFETALRGIVSSRPAGEADLRAGGGELRPSSRHAPLDPAPSPQGGGQSRGATRFLRDLAAEILHNTLPEHYPLMQRWVWDVRANSGVLREIWHDPQAGEDTDSVVIDIPDAYETFLVLREELSQFLADNGVFRDMIWHVDLVCAQVYGDYINAQGGAWLKTEFGSESDPLEHTRRIVGLDRVGRAGRGRVSGEWSVVRGAIGKDG